MNLSGVTAWVLSLVLRVVVVNLLCQGFNLELEKLVGGLFARGHVADLALELSHGHGHLGYVVLHRLAVVRGQFIGDVFQDPEQVPGLAAQIQQGRQ
jgi:hypothetical protein